jgi:hypothetical protein
MLKSGATGTHSALRYSKRIPKINILPYYEVSTNEEKEEKKFSSPLEKPKRVIKDKTNRINFYS